MSVLRTFRGHCVDLLDPDPSEIDILDIAHALSLQCRYAGHVREFYSVAQHSVLVSQLCDRQDAFWGLLHDAAEAYLGDIIRPLKVTRALDAYRDIERVMQAAVCTRFGLSPNQPASVARVDSAIVAVERNCLLAAIPTDCSWARSITPQPPEVARRAFLARFDELQAISCGVGEIGEEAFSGSSHHPGSE